MQTIIANTITSNAVFEDGKLKTETSVRALVTAQQKSFQSTHGMSAIALMVANGYIAIRKIITNATAEIQAVILDEHGVAPASSTTSAYTPWIKVQWGEESLDTSRTFTDSKGVKRVVWEPNRAMEIYHHTMEELEELGVATTDASKVAEIIMKNGGPAAMARARQKALREREKPDKDRRAEVRRDLLLAEARGPVVDLALDLPEGAGDYMTLLVRKVEGSGFEVLGVANANATAALDKVAADRFADLARKRDDRERDERFAAALEQARTAERERVLGGLTADQRKTLMVKLSTKGKRKTAVA